MSVPRSRRSRVLGALAVVTLALVASAFMQFGGHSPATASAGGVSGPTVLTVRTDGERDTLWLLSPADGSATQAGTLPGPAADVAVSPDGASVAYLPLSDQGPTVWIGYGPLGPKTLSLRSAGAKVPGSMTWVSDDEMVVSASTTGKYYDARTARLFLLNVRTGDVSAFRGLRGAEPSADPASGKIAYVRFTKLDNGSTVDRHAPKYRESLMLLDLATSGAGETVSSSAYRLVMDGDKNI